MAPPHVERGPNVLSAGLTWTVCVALFAYLGHLLDGRVGTTPLFLVLGAVLGAVGGFIHFVSRVAPDVLPFGGKSTDKRASPPDPDRDRAP
ncbi:MAG: AtpZ/AtpI family protein [Planctomycetota bacterium]